MKEDKEGKLKMKLSTECLLSLNSDVGIQANRNYPLYLMFILYQPKGLCPQKIAKMSILLVIYFNTLYGDDARYTTSGVLKKTFKNT